ncbi:hypothetical protein [Actinomadura macrotermitis]|uniref:Uncharacterized protein n=1 Tax=Actinomadura macrotermitis TaxID=2585200 RepID=A0A7K0C3L3_9ACTN|nr:hypothetical protein [Actinomadura macrotermitis]MQY08031.1 hypothetical protein [Actinomadura macrotermitis]
MSKKHKTAEEKMRQHRYKSPSPVSENTQAPGEAHNIGGGDDPGRAGTKGPGSMGYRDRGNAI